MGRPRRIIGVDAANLSAGIALVENGELIASLSFTPWDPLQLEDWLAYKVIEPVRFAAFEVGLHGHRKTAAGISWACGMVACSLLRTGIIARRSHVKKWTPGEWRTHWGWAGLSTDECKEKAMEKWPKCSTHDEAEACGIALAADALL